MVEYLVTHHGLSKDTANAVVKGMAWKMRDVLLEGKTVFIAGLVTIEPVHVMARTQRMFGVLTDLPARYKLRFRTCKEFVRQRAKRTKGPRDLI